MEFDTAIVSHASRELLDDAPKLSRMAMNWHSFPDSKAFDTTTRGIETANTPPRKKPVFDEPDRNRLLIRHQKDPDVCDSPSQGYPVDPSNHRDAEISVR